ncbi:tyrosine-type recombinase/integrase [Clostridium butyricum]|uniref:tyrosine-type recombinase/integrase n=1 Tax=Clostridium butyricum TaxID=1492 RepID=UPI002105A659|nr:site-specific integrase [Clostridium butyricum]MCQ2014683.1 site-specific integrase [Clostridium butyricum]MCQ2026550.1 site-specific integrase [Clostridium butyricum]
MAKTNYTTNGNDYYRVSLELGIDADGKRIRKRFYGKTKKEAEQKKQDFIIKQAQGINNERTFWFAQTFKTWLFEVVKMSDIKPTTFARYEGLYRNYIENSPFACMNIDKIEPLYIQRYYNDLYKKQKKSCSQITYLNKFIKQFFNYCVDCRYLLINPCSGNRIALPKENVKEAKSKDVQIFSTKEIKKIINSDDSKIKYIALIALATGMRRGEVIALTETDIDLKNNEIHIRRTIATTTIFDDNNNRSSQVIVQEPKTKNSIRDIPLPDSIKLIIKKSILLKNQERIKAGQSYSCKNLNFIFLSELGNFLNAGNLDKTWSKYLKALEIPHKKFHALRHTYATKQFENDIPLKTVSMLLGHSDIMMTANTYTHVLKKQKEKTIDILGII